MLAPSRKRPDRLEAAARVKAWTRARFSLGAEAAAGTCGAPRDSDFTSPVNRLRTLSLAKIVAPALPNTSLPPAWSKCQCVLIRYFGFPLASSSTFARLAEAFVAYWSSIRNTPSSPTLRPRLPPCPISM